MHSRTQVMGTVKADVEVNPVEPETRDVSAVVIGRIPVHILMLKQSESEKPPLAIDPRQKNENDCRFPIKEEKGRDSRIENNLFRQGLPVKTRIGSPPAFQIGRLIQLKPDKGTGEKEQNIQDLRPEVDEGSAHVIDFLVDMSMMALIVFRKNFCGSCSRAKSQPAI